ncbi:MAG: diphthamide biosynthesis enzyme Dph2 [Candidatus Aenigmarchaeota archaeon]|nr:diphthamide biosynthesis enzyme Dph2 [Candidatus Aenigmarchaeota archaeon]
MLTESVQKKIISILKIKKPKCVAVSVPEGMKTDLKKISQLIESQSSESLLITEPCFGACDLRDYEAKLFGCDLFIHFGHSDFGLKTLIPTQYIEVFSDYSPIKDLRKDIEKIKKYKKIALCSTIQHILKLEEIKNFLEQENKTVFIAKSKKAKYNGQILGCDASGVEAINNKFDCILFIGGGMFHPIALLEKTDVPVFTVGPDKKGIVDITSKRNLILKRKIIKQKKFETAQTVGLLVSFKKGQLQKNIFEIKKKLLAQGKDVYILAMDYISNEKILGIDVDILVNTACPRIEEDNLFDATVINLRDIVF